MSAQPLSALDRAVLTYAIGNTISGRAGCTWITEFVKGAGIPLKTALQCVDDLFARGLLEPYFNDPEARRVAVCITMAGRQALDPQAASEHRGSSPAHSEPPPRRYAEAAGSEEH